MRGLSRIWYLLNLPCSKISELVSLSLDRELPFAERLAVRSHLLYCKACRRFRSQLLSLRSALAKFSSEVTGAEHANIPRLTPQAQDRIKRALRDADAPGG
jgi:hypothetical protein